VQGLISLASRPVLRQQAIAGRPPMPSSEPVRLWWAGAALSGAPENQGRESASVPPLDAADIELPGPMLAEWSVPTGARRLAGWAELPRDCWTWGNCVIVLSLVRGDEVGASGTELFREALSADSPVAEFNIDVGAAARS